MMRIWIGTALLAGSWLLGQSYYLPAQPVAWVLVVAIGVLLLGGNAIRLPERRQTAVALVLLVPMIVVVPWPWRMAPLLIAAGLAVELLPIPRRWPRWVARGAVVAGAVMIAQSLAMAFYTGMTARSHDLPWPLPEMLAGLTRLAGVDAAADGSTVAIHSIRQVHRLAATWDLLVDPTSLCFFVGSAVAFGLIAWGRLPDEDRWKAWGGALWRLTVIALAWLPVRATLLMAVYLHRVSRADAETPLHAMNHFFSPWVLLLLLAVPVAAAWRLIGKQSGKRKAESGTSVTTRTGTAGPFPLSAFRFPLSAALLWFAAAVLTAAVVWDPVGQRKAGRVKIVERHSDWEWTDRPYDTTRFGHDSGYNYAAVYRYCSQFYEMSRLTDADKIDQRTLRNCDVLVIKTPTERYTPDEVDEVVEFVRRGGSLLLIGDHTNVFNSGSYMNDVTRKMGFTFRDDLLFGFGESPYDQQYCPPRTPHPAVQHLPPTDLAVSCSIDPGSSSGRAVMLGTGLWSLPPDYRRSNYHTVPQHGPDMRYGAFVQLWSTRHGHGRVAAFTDSTIFSNFCVFQPGKVELFAGMIEWLNHDAPNDPRPWLLTLGVLLLGVGFYLAFAQKDAWLVLVAAGTCGFAVASVAIAGHGAAHIPVPTAERPLPRIAIERTTSDVPLSKGPYIQENDRWEYGTGYGLFEQWISRVELPGGRPYTARRRGMEVFDGDAVVVICPQRSVGPQYIERLVQYVKQEGGRLLVIDSPENTDSTANDLLRPFGLAVRHDRIFRGNTEGRPGLMITDDWPALQIRRACTVTGGEPIARLGTEPVAAVARFGDADKRGTVMAVGFGSVFNDSNMGGSWMQQPTADVLFESNTYIRYNVQFALLRSLMTGRPVESLFAADVVLDETLSDVFSRSTSTTPRATGVNRPEAKQFSAFRDWIGLFGYSTTRAAGADALEGDLLVVLYPTRPADDRFRNGLANFVRGGGHLLVIDSPDNAGSTANALLVPFGLSFDVGKPLSGELVVADKDNEHRIDVPVARAWQVRGGKPSLKLGPETPVGATIDFGAGSVTALGCGSVFSDARMRASWEAEEPARLLAPANLESAVLRAILTSQPIEKTVPSVSNDE